MAGVEDCRRRARKSLWTSQKEPLLSNPSGGLAPNCAIKEPHFPGSIPLHTSNCSSRRRDRPLLPQPSSGTAEDFEFVSRLPSPVEHP